MSEGAAPARAALAGNPSDGYGGAVLAVTVPALEARARTVERRSARSRLVEAVLDRFRREFGREPAPVRFETTIPRSVGLGGSSAIVIAVLRALCAHHGLELEPTAMAQLALSIEVDDLGIAAGLQDRLVQCHGGLVFMEFAGPAPRCEPLPPSALPPALVAWRPDSSEHSGVVHGDLRGRFARGDRDVVAAMARLGDLARRGREALVAGEIPQLRQVVDASFDIRRELMALNPLHVEMVEVARAHGAAANYTGSGGAIVALCNDLRHRSAVAQALLDLGCGVVLLDRPTQNRE